MPPAQPNSSIGRLNKKKEKAAAMTSHIPDQREQMVRYSAFYSNVSRGLRQKVNQDMLIPTTYLKTKFPEKGLFQYHSQPFLDLTHLPTEEFPDSLKNPPIASIFPLQIFNPLSQFQRIEEGSLSHPEQIGFPAN